MPRLCPLVNGRLVNQIDHIAIRTEQPERLFTFFTQVLGLPVALPLIAYPALTSGSVLLGNTYLEVACFRPPWPAHQSPAGHATPSRGFVLSLEPNAEPLDVVEYVLRQREVPHSGVLPFYGQVEPERPPVKIWANLLLGGLFGDNLFARSFLSLTRFPRRMPSAQAAVAQTQSVLNRLVDSFFPNGLVYFTEYYQRAHVNGSAGDQAYMGPLGIRRALEVRVGARYIAPARERWARVLNPLQPEAPGYWRLGNGPALRLILNGTDRVQTLVLKVRSLSQARAFLREQNLLRGEFDDEILVELPGDRDLDIRLVA